MAYIKTLTAPLIIIAGLALLTACGGGATPAEETAVDCTETPFDSPDMCEDEKITICQTHGTNVEAGGHASCDDLIRTDCVANPFMYDGCDTLDDKIRTDFCAILPANRFNAQCISRDIGDDGDRDTACQMYGTNVGAGGHATCDGRIRTACIANPFEYKGCDTLDDKIRTDFCKMEQHIFTHAECMNLDNINDIRMTYCSVTDIFHATCLDNTYGGDGERDDACQTHGTNVGAGGHASCDGGRNDIRGECVLNPFMHLGCDTLDADKEDNIRTKFCAILPTNRFNAQCILRDIGDDDDRDDTCEMYGITPPMGHSTCDGRIRTACVANPFEHLGCNSLEDKIRTDFCAIVPANRFNQGCIDGGLGGGGRTTFCNMPENLFNQNCLDNDLGDDTARDPACLGSEAGDPEHPSCANRPGVITACQMNPFSTTNTGCENLDTIVSIREVYCGTSANFTGRCTVNYDDWKDSFNTVPPTTPNTTTRRNEFLNAGTDALDAALDEVFPDEHSETATALHLGELKGGDATDGVAYFIFQDSGQQYHYAGLDSQTDLGAPSFQETGTAVWKGRFNATKLDQATEFELEITFGGAGDVAGSIAAFVPSGDDHFLLTGNYDENGVISGTVDYGAFTDRNRAVPTNSDATRKGILTGLIGRQGAVGVFVSGTGANKDNITGGTGIATGYVGGFVANPFQGNVSYSDWVTFSSPPATPAAAPPSGNLNQFVQTIRNDVIKAAHVGQNFNVNLGSLDGDPADGFSVYHVTATNDYLVGLSATTSLGVALASAPVAAWDGSFVVYENGVATTTPFKLMVDFASRSIDATVTNTLYSFVNTSFSNANGVLRGFVNRGDITGNLAGLIGAEGAVGVFHSDNNLEFSFAGGFVAVSPPCVLADNCVNHANWLGIFGASPPPATRAAANVGTAAVGSFLNLADGVRDISEAGLTHRNTNTHLTLDGDETNGRHGVTYLTGRSTANFNQAFVAVLPTTNLGAPLASPPAITTWPGKFYHTSLEDTSTVNFEIDFNGTAITATPRIEILTGVFRTTTFALRFTPATGVITGNVTNGVGVSATARGLIGEAGLVGVYVQESPSQAENTGVYFGGFIADNPNN